MRDGLVKANPTVGLACEMGLRRKTRGNQHIKAFTAEQLERLFEVTTELYPHYYALFLTMARTGVRIGEAIALRWSDVDFDGRIEQRQRW